MYEFAETMDMLQQPLREASYGDFVVEGIIKVIVDM